MKKKIIALVTAGMISLSAGMTTYPVMDVSATTVKSASGAYKIKTAKTLYKSVKKNKIMVIRKNKIVKLSKKTNVNGKMWYKVKYGQKTGWIKGKNLSKVKVTSAKKISKTYKAKTKKTMYRKAGTFEVKMGYIKKGSILSAKYSRKVNGKTWYKVKLSSGKYGWTSSTNIKKYVKQTSNSGSKLISTGAQYLGVPYVWGGTTPSGFDCSGFTKYVYKKVLGKNLPRTSGEQYNKSKKISKSQLKKGDLVFFSASGGRITHVAMYAGNGKLLHAAGNQVQYQSLYGYWDKLVVGYGTYQ